MWFTGGNSGLGRIDLAGKITQFPVGPSGGLTAGPDGAIWFTEPLAASIGRITPTGSITHYAIPPDTGLPRSIAAGSDGALWFTARESSALSLGAIGRITTSGALTIFPLPAPINPGAITAGPGENMWFTYARGAAQPHGVGAITHSGSVTLFPNAGNIFGGADNQPNPDITVGADGNLWLVEPGANRLARMTTAGAFTQFDLNIDAATARPEGVVAGPSATIWFTASGLGNGRVGWIKGGATVTPTAPIRVKTTSVRASDLVRRSGVRFAIVVPVAGKLSGNFEFAPTSGPKARLVRLGTVRGSARAPGTTTRAVMSILPAWRKHAKQLKGKILTGSITLKPKSQARLVISFQMAMR
jgi:streptogramin lyase